MAYERIVVLFFEVEVEAMTEVRRKKLVHDDLHLLTLALDPPSESSQQEAGASNGQKRPRTFVAEDVVPWFKRFCRRLEAVLCVLCYQLPLNRAGSQTYARDRMDETCAFDLANPRTL